MTHDDLRTMLDFNYWARDRMLEALDPLTPEQWLRDLGSSFRSVRDTAAHVYAAEWIWYMRWRGTSPPALVSADEFPDVATLRRAWSDLEQNVRAFVEELGETGINRVVAYKMMSGVAAASPFWQMLFHVVNHGSYHRGQVTTMLRQLGAAPAKSCDMITFYRERTAASA